MQKFLKLLRISIYITAGITLLNLLVFLDEPLTWSVFLEYSGICFLFSFVLTLVNAYYYDGVSIKYDWATQPKTRLWVGALGSIVLSIIVFGLLRMFLSIVVYGQTYRHFMANEESFAYVFAIIVTVLISLFLHAFHFYKALQENKVKEQKIIAGTASAKFDALKNQLDPHFLFNSLNVLTSLIEEDPNQAQKFTTSLSKVYRYVLEQKNKDLVSVDEELQFAKTYVKLLKMRFEDSIVLDIPEKASNPEAKIVPLSLQLLLENAVKHNIVNSVKPLHIKIYEDNGQLRVTNNLQEKQVVKKSSGVGLQNIQQRYELLSNRKMEITKTATDFTVNLPILTQQVSVVETQDDYIDDKRYQKAKEKVEAIKGFYGNLIAYCIVIPCLAFLNYKTTSFPWIIFPVVGWGFGLLTHGLEAFGYHPIWGKRWEERKLRELMEKEDF
ncbi:2TM domain-containing protein [Maribacter sp. MMG018]|uniref:2TM domain-containing protein n=1 Tax=Maribacter sp. MMG018 TaxID=2822688 RepID=UPI001B35D613|nr:2TM domain-containing protein [Maribacter sp. MMG018]MBQ4914769.1 2TM domain-containing protein [Maribacter sp. MMG018]